jgi:integrase
VKVVATERPWVTIPTVRELIRFARFRDPNLEVVIRLGALAGLRRGEICGLRWNDIDLDAGTATVRRNRVVANGAVGESSPKTTSSAATITLDPDTVAALDRHRRRRADLIEADVPTTEHDLHRHRGRSRSDGSVGSSHPAAKKHPELFDEELPSEDATGRKR